MHKYTANPNSPGGFPEMSLEKGPHTNNCVGVVMSGCGFLQGSSWYCAGHTLTTNTGGRSGMRTRKLALSLLITSSLKWAVQKQATKNNYIIKYRKSNVNIFLKASKETFQMMYFNP